jgi:glycosyltransferase involved in cell wall biosynthesis
MKKIFVLLPAHRDAAQHAQEFAADLAADESPWGFSKAANRGYQVKFSAGKSRSLLERLVRRLTGFDLIHAWRERRNMAKADIILTHTENEYLAAAFVLRLCNIKPPRLQGNTLWMFNEWSQLDMFRKAIVRYCFPRVDVLTCNAVPNVAGGKTIITKPVVYVPYGISTESFPLIEPVLRLTGPILAVGNDKSRDWGAIELAAKANPKMPVRIASSVAPKTLSALNNVALAATHGVTETRDLYDDARMVVVPVYENWHASGITVILEAVARAAPVVAADEGGLREYFSGKEILLYGPLCTYKNLNEAISACLESPDEALERARKAQARFLSSSYDSQSFVDRLLQSIYANPEA